MATFNGLAGPQNFAGTPGEIDTVSYRNTATAAVTIDVLAGGSGFAADHTYTSIERFLLSNLAGETDYFFGSSADESVRGYAGYNIIDTGAGNDTVRGGNDGNEITGGAGADDVKGGAGDDIFYVAAGDLVSGDKISGGSGGHDTIVLTGGGTGDTFDLASASYRYIDAIQFDSSGTLILKNNAHQDRIFGTKADGEVVQVNEWRGRDTSLDGIMDDILVFLNNGIDMVTWSEKGANVTAQWGPFTDTLEVAYTSLDGSITETLTIDLLNVFPDIVEWEGDATDNEITGDARDEIFYVGAGEDTLSGEGGFDAFILSDTDNDGAWGAFFTYAEQATTSGGARASAPLNGKIEVNDFISGGEGTDVIIGSDLGEAVILYNDNTAALVPATATPRIEGIEAFDMGDGDDVVNLTATTSQAEYTIDTTIIGGEGSDYLFGGAGDDTIDGGAGADRLIGWKGDDELTGGADADRFLYAPDVGGGTDTITDFEIGTDDIFAIGFGIGSGTAAENFSDAITAGVLTVADNGVDTTLTLTDGVLSTDIVLTGVVGVTADDFAFFA